MISRVIGVGVVLVGALLGVTLPSRAAHAQCPAIAGADADSTLAGAPASQRLEFLRRGMRASARKARTWTIAWGTTYAALSVGQLALAPFFPDEARVDRYVSATGALLGLLLVSLRPLPVMGDAALLDADVARASPSSDPCALVDEAERLLVRDAAFEDRVNRWWSRAATMGFNAACGLLLSLVFHRYAGAALNTVGGLTVGQMMINTQPTDSIELLRRYRAGLLETVASSRTSLEWAVAPVLQAGSVGIAGRVTF